MARINNLTNFLIDVAAAIKEKKEDVTDIPAANFDTEILNLPSQGVYQQKTINITQNGSQTVTPDTDYDAIDELTINTNIPLQTRNYTFTQNTTTTLTPEQGYAGFDEVVLTISVDNDETTATANDLLSPKTAYSNHLKITGAIIPTYKPTSGLIKSSVTDATSITFDMIDYDAGIACYLKDKYVHIVKIVNGMFDYDNELVSEDVLWNQNIFQKHAISLKSPDYINKCVVCYTCNDTTTSSGGAYTYGCPLVFYTIDLTNWTISKVINSSMNVSFAYYNKAINIYSIDSKPGYVIGYSIVNYAGSGTRCYYHISKYDFSSDTVSVIKPYEQIKSYSGRYIEATYNINISSNLDGNIFFFRHDIRKLCYIVSFSEDFSTVKNVIYDSDSLQYYPIGDGYCFSSDGKIFEISTSAIGSQVGTCLTNLINGYVIKNSIVYNNNIYNFDEDTLTISVYDTYSGSIAVAQNNSYVMLNRSGQNMITILKYGVSDVITQLERNGTVYSDTIDGTAVASDILRNKTAYSSTGKITGTMPDNGSLTYIPSISQQTIPAGYTSGGTIAAISTDIDPDFVPENIKAGINIFGITGELDADSILMPRIYNGNDIGTTNSNTRTWVVQAQLDSYCYAIVYHRTTITEFTSGWTQFQTYTQTGNGSTDYITVFYKKATETTETFRVTTDNSGVRLGGVILSTMYNYTLPTVVYNQSPASQTTTTNITTRDIVICSVFAVTTGYEADNWSIDMPNISYPCRETDNNNYSRFNVFVPLNTDMGTIQSYVTNECSRIIVLRFPENHRGTDLIASNIKKGVTIFGVTGTYEGPDASL